MLTAKTKEYNGSDVLRMVIDLLLHVVHIAL